MISRFAKIILLIMLTFILFNASVFGEEKDKKWVTLADNTQVYGYWQDAKGHWVLVECNPSTGGETGFAFLNSGEYKTVEKEVVDRYEYVKKEDLKRVRALKPVSVEKVFAPNAPSDIGVDTDHYRETGQVRMISTYGAMWPGANDPVLVPTSEAKRYLIVAAVTNPNPFPVKANVDVNIKTKNNPIGESVHEVVYQANETRYIKLNDQFQSKIVDKVGQYVNYSYQPGWTTEYNSTLITENLDPDLPDYLKPYYGWYDASDISGNGNLPLWDPDVLTNNSKIAFSICNLGGTYWSMEGYISRNKDGGWQVSGTCSPANQQSNATSKILAWVNSAAPAFLTVRYNESVSLAAYGIRIDRMHGAQAGITNQSLISEWDLTGPIVRGYNGGDISSYEEDYNSKGLWTLNDPNYSEWHGNKIPIIKQEPMFIAKYEFIPQEHPKVGCLKKTVVPGIYLTAETTELPRLRQTVNLVSATSQYLSGSRYRHTVTYDVNIQAINKSGFDCRFTSYGNMKFYIPAAKIFKNHLQNNAYLNEYEAYDSYRDRYMRYSEKDEPVVSNPDFDKIDLGTNTIYLANGTNNVIYSQRRTVDFTCRMRDISTSDFGTYLNDSRDAPFIKNGNLMFEFVQNSQFVGIGVADMQYRYYNYRDDRLDKDYTSAIFGNFDGIPFLSNIRKGFPLLASDPLYSRMLSYSGRKTINLNESTYNVHNKYWVVAELPRYTSDNPHYAPGYKDYYQNTNLANLASRWEWKWEEEASGGGGGGLGGD